MCGSWYFFFRELFVFFWNLHVSNITRASFFFLSLLGACVSLQANRNRHEKKDWIHENCFLQIFRDFSPHFIFKNNYYFIHLSGVIRYLFLKTEKQEKSVKSVPIINKQNKNGSMNNKARINPCTVGMVEVELILNCNVSFHSMKICLYFYFLYIQLNSIEAIRSVQFAWIHLDSFCSSVFMVTSNRSLYFSAFLASHPRSWCDTQLKMNIVW